MKDIVGVQIFHCFTYFLQLGARFLLAKLSSQLDVLIQTPFLHVLKHYVDVLSIAEAAIHLHNVRMIQVETDLYLLDELIQHQTNRLFCHFFYCQQITRFFMESRVYFSESAFTFAGTKLKILYPQLRGFSTGLFTERELEVTTSWIGLIHWFIFRNGTRS